MAVRKDNVDLICSVAELAGMFEKTSSLSTFLDSTVSIVAWHMKAAVCSIYLIEGNELVLKATQGLSGEAVGRVKLDIGEGITGKALKELRTIRVGRASKHEDYKHFPGIEEEKFEAFLAVPITRKLTKIGVLVVQDPEADYFTDNDEKALRAIAGQLSVTLENARLLLGLGQSSDLVDTAEDEGEFPSFFRGQSTTDGIAIGKAMVMTTGSSDLSEMASQLDEHIPLERFDKAVRDTEVELEELQMALGTEHEDIAGLIFSAHLLMLKDESFSGKMRSDIEQGMLPATAVMNIINMYVKIFSSSSNPRLKEKVQDVLDLGHRLLLNLQSENREVHDYHGQIIIASDLMPSDVVRFAVQRAEGIVLLKRGITSHISILAKSMQIPMIQLDQKKMLQVRDGTLLIVDASQGTVFINPNEEISEKYTTLLATRENIDSIAAKLDDTTLTKDGEKVELLANVNLLSDIETARKLKADGIGLYRSEFPFLIRDSFPTEEEQLWIYNLVYEKFANGPVVFRTLDIGGDKLASYAQETEEDNPFLGLRALRFSLQHPKIFRQQLRAMLRAGYEKELSIMFPLVSSTDEFIEAKDRVQECINELSQSDLTFNPNPKIGVMVELPSAVELIEELAKASDFISIGSNDLTQYLLAVDRTNDQVSHMYKEHHPAVIRALYRIVKAARKFKKPVSICGEMATHEEMIPFLIGIGLRRISVDPRSIPLVQNYVKNVDSKNAKRLADSMITLGSVKAVELFLSGMHLDLEES